MRIVIDLVDKAERLPTMQDADAHGCVVALHQMDGLVVMHVSNVVKFGRFITHWGRYRLEGEEGK